MKLYCIALAVFQILFCFVFNTRVIAEEDKIMPPPSYIVAIRAIVDNSKGAVLRVEDPKSPVYGATVIIPPGSLIRQKEEVLLSYTKDLVISLEKDSREKQSSLAFVVQVNGSMKKSNIELIFPLYAASSSNIIVFARYATIEGFRSWGNGSMIDKDYVKAQIDFNIVYVAVDVGANYQSYAGPI